MTEAAPIQKLNCIPPISAAIKHDTVLMVKNFIVINGMDADKIKSGQAQLRQLDEEIKELFDAASAKDDKEVVDAIADVGFVIISLELLGYDTLYVRNLYNLLVSAFALNNHLAFAAIEMAAVSNLTKADYSAEDAELTARDYASIGVQTQTEEIELPNGVTAFITKVIEDCKDMTGKEYFAGKVLKSTTRYEPARFAELAAQVVIDYELFDYAIGSAGPVVFQGEKDNEG